MMAAINGQPVEVVGEQGRHSDIGVLFQGNDRKNAALHQAIVKTGADATGNQDVDSDVYKRQVRASSGDSRPLS